MTRLPRTILILLTMLLCIGCDQASKLAARAQLPRGHAISLLGDTLRLQYVENPGAFLGLGGGLPGGVRRTLFVGGVTVALLAVVVATLAARRLPASRVLALALVCGGGAGNLIDRVFRDGRVIDFLNLGVGPLRTGVFNVADVALVAGALLLAFAGDTTRVRPRADAAPPPASPPTAPA